MPTHPHSMLACERVNEFEAFVGGQQTEADEAVERGVASRMGRVMAIGVVTLIALSASVVYFGRGGLSQELKLSKSSNEFVLKDAKLPPEHDCDLEFAHWKGAWSGPKKHYCCYQSA